MKVSVRLRDRRKRRVSATTLLLRLSAALFVCSVLLLGHYHVHAAKTVRVQEEAKYEYYGSNGENADSSLLPNDPGTDNDAEKASKPESGIDPIKTIAWPTISPNAAMLSDFVPLFEKNNDLVGWLQSHALSEIDFPLVQRDNSFYLSHDFYRRGNVAGTVFLDMDCTVLPRNDNLVLHGHNMKNGSMFGKLYLYLKPDFVKAQPFFTFSTLYEKGVYVPYAISIVSTHPASPQFVSFVQSEFSSDEEMLSYAQWLIEFSALDFPVDVRADDRLLTLATCHGSDESERLILALRELRPQENQEILGRIIREGLTIRRLSTFGDEG